jgi:hypothetical protein
LLQQLAVVLSSTPLAALLAALLQVKQRQQAAARCFSTRFMPAAAADIGGLVAPWSSPWADVQLSLLLLLVGACCTQKEPDLQEAGLHSLAQCVS